MKKKIDYTSDDDYHVDVNSDVSGTRRAHHFAPEDVENADWDSLGGSALNPANRDNLTDDQAKLASDALAGRELTEEEEEELRDLFGPDGPIEPGDAVKSYWEDEGEA